MGRVASIDGVLSPLDEARVSVRDRAFLYGDSVFETLRTYGGRPFALDEHLGRLERSAGLVFIDMPVAREVLVKEIHEAIAAAGNEESYIRVMVTRGSGELGLDPGLAVKPLRVVLVTELHAPGAAAYADGISAITHAVRRPADATSVAGAKIGNYLTSVLAMRDARAAGAQEALVVDASSRVVEGATSNVFFAAGGRIITPPLDAGILPGITRARVLEAANAIGVSVELRAPGIEELPRFDEIFISSSIRELLAVVRLDGRVVGSGVPGALYRRLLDAFHRAIGV